MPPFFIFLNQRGTTVMTSKQGVSNKRIPAAVILAPALIFAAVFIIGGLAPMGGKSLLSDGAWQRILESFAWFRGIFSGDNDLLYNFSRGLGDGSLSFWGLQFLSPLNFLLFLLPAKMVVFGVWILNGVRILMSAALFYSLALKLSGDKKLSFIGSLMYSAAGVSLALLWQSMWLDSLWILPLFISGLTACIESGAGKKLAFSAFLMGICCPVAGLILIPASVIISVFYCVSAPEGKSSLPSISPEPCFALL